MIKKKIENNFYYGWANFQMIFMDVVEDIFDCINIFEKKEWHLIVCIQIVCI